MNFDKLSNKEVGDNVSLSLYLFNSPMFRINQPSKQKQCPFLLQVLFFVFSKLTGAIALIMGNSHNIILSLQSVQFIFVFDFFVLQFDINCFQLGDIIIGSILNI